MCFVFAEQFHAGANLFESDGTYSMKLDIYSNLLIQEDPVRANVYMCSAESEQIRLQISPSLPPINGPAAAPPPQ